MEKSIFSPRHERLLQLLKQVRQEAGLTQVELASILHTQQAVISNFERGERRLDLIELEQVCAAVGISLSDFVHLFEQMTADLPSSHPRT